MQRKGQVEIVAAVLLISVVVSGTYAAYSTSQSLQSSPANDQETLEELEPGSLEVLSCWLESSEVRLSVMNTGDEAINTTQLRPEINKKPIESFSTNKDIVDPQKSFTLNLGRKLSNRDRIGLTGGQGTDGFYCNRLPDNLIETSPTDPKAGEQVIFDASSYGPGIDSVSWDIDGEFRTGETVETTFTEPGSKEVEVSITYEDGAETADSLQIEVGSSVNADFSFNPTNPSASEEVDFDASESEGDIESYNWQFEEGDTKTGLTTSHTFSSTGEKEVELTVKAGEITDTRTKIVDVTNSALDAGFTFSPNNTLPGNGIEFTEASEGSIQSYRWNMSDGSIIFEESFEHSYGSPGNYDVTLKISSGDGESDKAIRTVGVNDMPTADFGFSPANPETGEQIQFEDQSTDGDTIQDYQWDFGDGETSSQQNPSHTYQNTGTYQVSLTVTDEYGATATETIEIEVKNGLNADFTYSPQQPTTGETINFEDSSSGSIESYQWDFGDGETSSQQNPSHTYQNTGTYQANLEITGSGGSTDSISKEVEVQSDTETITAIENPSATEWMRTDFEIEVTDTGSGSLTCTYRIDDGADGSWSQYNSRECDSVNSATISVGESGECSNLGNACKIETKVSDSDGDEATDQRTFRIDYLPPATSLSLNQGSDSTDLQIEADLSASSQHSDVDTCQIDWENDGSTDKTIEINSGSFTDSISHTYSSSGTYTVELSCTDIAGNLQIRTEDITVPSDTSLQYDILEDRTTEEAVDQDFINPQYKIDTNAEGVYFQLNGSEYQMFDDGSHSDEAAGDQIYGITIDSTELLGEKETSLKFTKNGEEAVENTDNITFKRTPPAPSLSAEYTENGVMIEAETNFGKKTIVGLNVTVTNEGVTRMQKYIEKECSGSCQKLFDITPQDGDEATVKGNQSYLGLEGDTATAGAAFSSTANLKQADYLSNTGRNYTEESYWFSALFGISVEGFSEDNITDIYLTDENGDKIGEVKDIGYNVEGFLDLDPIEIARWNATVQPEEISGSSETLNVTVELDNGQVLTHELETLQIVEDNSPPSLDKFKPTSYLQNGNLTLDLIIDDNLQESASCDLYLNSTGEKLGSCSFSDTPGSALDEKVNISTPDGENFGFIKVNISDNAGNYQTKVKGPLLLNPDTALTAIETHGDPRNKINLLIYGHKMSKSRTEEAANRNIDNFFSSGDLSYFDNYRSYFNWYLVDTDKELCSTIEGYGGTNCPDGRDAISDLETYSDTLKNSRAGRIYLDDRKYNDGEWIRSVAYWDYTVISEQDSSSVPFSHELGHLIWRFNDEYDSNPGESNVFRDSYFFPESMNNETFNVGRYPNIWHGQSNCEANVTNYYSASLDTSDCYQQSSDPIGYIIQGAAGESLMKDSSDPVLYANHEKRIQYLHENNGVYSAN